MISHSAASIAAVVLLLATAGDAFFDKGVHAPFIDPKTIDVALQKFYDDLNGPNWPRPWGDRWGKESSCAWDGNERAKPAPFGTRCLNGGWHKLPPQDDGGLLYMEHFSRMAEGVMPREFEAAQMMDYFSVWNNKIRGHIWNTSMHEFLHRIDLSYNEFDGELPEDFMLRDVRQMELINFAHNKFSGPIPKVIGTLQILQGLRLDHNEFSGSLPVEITKLPQLRHMKLCRNKFTGSVPSLADLKTLAWLDLSYNGFEGTLPELPPSVSRVDFSFNKFSGTIPESYGKLPMLRSFNCTGCDIKCPSDDLLAHVPFSTHCRPAKSRAWE